MREDPVAVVVEALADLVYPAEEVATREGEDKAGRRPDIGRRTGRARLLGGLNTRSRLPPAPSLVVPACIEDVADRPARPAGFRHPREVTLLVGELTDDEHTELVLDDSPVVRGDSAARTLGVFSVAGGELALLLLTLASRSRLFPVGDLPPVTFWLSFAEALVRGTDLERT